MIDKKWIGYTFPALTTRVERGQLAFFAKAVSEKNKVYLSEAEAQRNGYSSIPAPLTFGFSLNLATPEPFGYMKEMGVPLGRVLHGEQKFQYFKPILEGDLIHLQRTIVDVVSKKGGAMELIKEEIILTNQQDELVGKMSVVTVVRN